MLLLTSRKCGLIFGDGFQKSLDLNTLILVLMKYRDVGHPNVA